MTRTITAEMLRRFATHPVVLLIVAALVALDSASRLAHAQNAPPRQSPPRLQTAPRTGQPGAGAPNGQGTPQPQGPAGQQHGFGPAAPPQAPFALNPQQQQQLDQVLAQWEKTSANVQSLQCTLHRWEHDPIFGKSTYGIGELKYKAPDKGKYLIRDFRNKKLQEIVEHWVCDGKAIYEFDHANSKQVVRELPVELQGKAIADGPLPFLFGAEAGKLKARYWMRLIQPPPAQQNLICIEAFPKNQRDAANFRRAEVLLDPKEWMPYSLMLEMPNGKARTTHVFKDPKVNGIWQGIVDAIMKDTQAPLGWTRIVEPASDSTAEGGGQPGPTQSPPRTAQQPQPSTVPRN